MREAPEFLLVVEEAGALLDAPRVGSVCAPLAVGARVTAPEPVGLVTGFKNENMVNESHT